MRVDIRRPRHPTDGIWLHVDGPMVSHVMQYIKRNGFYKPLKVSDAVDKPVGVWKNKQRNSFLVKMPSGSCRLRSATSLKEAKALLDGEAPADLEDMDDDTIDDENVKAAEDNRLQKEVEHSEVVAGKAVEDDQLQKEVEHSAPDDKAGGSGILGKFCNNSQVRYLVSPTGIL